MTYKKEYRYEDRVVLSDGRKGTVVALTEVQTEGEDKYIVLMDLSFKQDWKSRPEWSHARAYVISNAHLTLIKE